MISQPTRMVNRRALVAGLQVGSFGSASAPRPVDSRPAQPHGVYNASTHDYDKGVR